MQINLKQPILQEMEKTYPDNPVFEPSESRWNNDKTIDTNMREGINVNDRGQCVQCGFCCLQGPCAYGRWDAAKKRCAFLTAEMKCALYRQIQEAEKDSPYPMFGSGCSSTLFNEMREAKLRAMRRAED